jgi:hypothetical protein
MTIDQLKRINFSYDYYVNKLMMKEEERKISVYANRP